MTVLKTNSANFRPLLISIVLKTMCEERMCNEISKQNAEKYLSVSESYSTRLKLSVSDFIAGQKEYFKRDPEFNEFCIQYPKV